MGIKGDLLAACHTGKSEEALCAPAGHGDSVRPHLGLSGSCPIEGEGLNFWAASHAVGNWCYFLFFGSAVVQPCPLFKVHVILDPTLN